MCYFTVACSSGFDRGALRCSRPCSQDAERLRPRKFPSCPWQFLPASLWPLAEAPFDLLSDYRSFASSRIPWKLNSQCVDLCARLCSLAQGWGSCARWCPCLWCALLWLSAFPSCGTLRLVHAPAAAHLAVSSGFAHLSPGT